MSTEQGNNSFRKPLFNFYIDRYESVENFRKFNVVLGATATVLGVIAGGPIGIGMGVAAVASAVTNETRLKKLNDKVVNDYQGVIRSVYDSQATKK